VLAVMFQMKELCSHGIYVDSSSLTYLGNPSMGRYFSHLVNWLVLLASNQNKRQGGTRPS